MAGEMALLIPILGILLGFFGVWTNHKEKVAKLTRAQVEAVVKQKMPDLNANSPEAAYRIIAGTARQMGIEVEAL